MITINGTQYRNLPEQVEKNKQDIENITKDKTVTIYTHILTSDVDPNVHTKFSGTITLIGDVVISVIGVVIEETVTYPVVAFNQIDANKDIMITGYNNHRVKIDSNDFDNENQYILY
ncbi:MAG TPA: hypothetical protein VFC79_13675 [Tissierellaceae bacterium]|nr:hypothetical protein [Tissierellaceae bacterium]